jgi:hypothetical protein
MHFLDYVSSALAQEHRTRRSAYAADRGGVKEGTSVRQRTLANLGGLAEVPLNDRSMALEVLINVEWSKAGP